VKDERTLTQRRGDRGVVVEMQRQTRGDRQVNEILLVTARVEVKVRIKLKEREEEWASTISQRTGYKVSSNGRRLAL